LADQLGVADQVTFVGYVSDGELVSLYRGAKAYINPSLSEGFGLQGLEAMAQGTPVLASRASCLPEVYGDAAEYFDPNDPADQARAIALMLDHGEVAERLRATGRKRLAQFSWKKMAQTILAVYEKAVKRSA
jgi:glycosyltransferase involved in cell wall biosynthesis